MPKRPAKKTGRAKPAGLPRAQRALTLVAQAEHALRQAIDDSVFSGGRLPALIDLAEQLGVSRETVRLAAERLQQEGLLMKQRRRGTFLRPAQANLRLEPAPSKTIGYIQADYEASAPAEAVTRGQGGLMLEGAVLEAGRSGCQLLVRIATALELRGCFGTDDSGRPTSRTRLGLGGRRKIRPPPGRLEAANRVGRPRSARAAAHDAANRFVGLRG